jgi:hypothetical protein
MLVCEVFEEVFISKIYSQGKIDEKTSSYFLQA